MEMEHINENLIKVLIDAQDLEDRGIDFLDLIGDQQSVERFFYSILEEVDVDRQFRESESITFQVMPNKDGLELYISRATPDELMDHWNDELSMRMIERSGTSKEAYGESDYGEKPGQKKTDALFKEIFKGQSGRMSEILVEFASLEEFLGAARQVEVENLSSDLYYVNQQYVLVVHLNDEGKELTEGEYHKLMTLLEYGEKRDMTLDLLQEHGKLIREGDALSFFGQNF